MRKDGETVLEYMTRVTTWLNYNNSMDELPNTAAAFQLFDLISDTYDVSLLEEVYAEILENDADPQPLEDFIKQYDMPWSMPWRDEEDERSDVPSPTAKED